MLVDSRFYEARFPGNRVVFDLADGRAVEAPIEWFPLLQAASKDAREGYEVEDDGRAINWPELGERVSVEAVMLVRFPANC
jgi:hypothetical protein